jgi:glycosyltransferase involved in cell wall biosynthesis
MQTLLLVTDAWNPQVNGVVRTLQKTKELLEQQGWRVVVVQPGLFARVPFFVIYPEIQLALFPLPTLVKILRQEKPTHIHIATEGPLGFTMRQVCRMKGLSFTTSYHTHFPLYLKGRGLSIFERPGMAYLRWFHKASTHVLVATASIKENLEYRGFTRIALWPLGVDTALFHPQAHAGTDSKKEPIFVYVGRLAVEKNVEEFCTLSLPGKKVLIGDGPLRPALQKKYGTTHEFLGYLHGEALARAVARADVFVFPSYTETFGLVIIEALACGVPVAAHNVMGPKDIITSGVDGYLGDDLADAARTCLSLSRDKCREKALRYSWDASVRALLSHLTPVSANKLP